MDLGIGEDKDFQDSPNVLLVNRYIPFLDKGIIACKVEVPLLGIGLGYAKIEDISIGALCWLATTKVLFKVSPEAFVAMNHWRKRWGVFLSVNYFLVEYCPTSRKDENVDANRTWLEYWRNETNKQFKFKGG